MTSFLDLVPCGEKVAVPGGREIDALGISVGGLAALMRRFPEVVDQLFAGKINPVALAATVPKALSVFIAAGIGCTEDEKAEQWADNLPLWAQVNLFNAIVRQTIGGDDSGPFVNKLTELAKLIGLETQLQNFQSDLAKTPAPSSPSPPESPMAEGASVTSKPSGKRSNTSKQTATLLS